MGSSSPRRVRVERGIYRQANGKYAVGWRHAGRLRFRTVGFDLTEVRHARLALIAATHQATVPVSQRLRFETIAGWWLERFEAKVAAGERHPRTVEAHRYQLDRHLLPALGPRAIASLAVDEVAELLHELCRKGCSAKTSANALATLQRVVRFARRCGCHDRGGDARPAGPCSRARRGGFRDRGPVRARPRGRGGWALRRRRQGLPGPAGAGCVRAAYSASCPAKNSSAVRVLVCCSPNRSTPRSARNARVSAATWNASPGLHFVDSSRIREPSG
jgi:hypothetical protein